MVRFHGAPPTHLTYEPLEALGLRHAFTTRHHAPRPGAGPALATVGVAPESLRFARQVHGTAILVADGAPAGCVGTGDALVTATPGVPLAVFTADCLAVVLVEPARGLLAVAHTGWRGTVAGLLGRVVAWLVEQGGARPDRLRAAVGPSIGPCCYEVGPLVAEPLARAFPRDWTRWARPGAPDRWWLDLWRANEDQLVAAGLPREAVFNPRLCTACRRDLFHSYRREGPGGQLAALAVLR